MNVTVCSWFELGEFPIFGSIVLSRGQSSGTVWREIEKGTGGYTSLISIEGCQ